VKFWICVACASKDDLQHHHLVPRAEGGSDDVSNLITLCGKCYPKLHERQTNGAYNHGKLVVAGQQAAMAAGVKFGRKPKLLEHQLEEARARHKAGEGLRSIARFFNVDHSTISRGIRAN
jgi:HNH endonuclease/Helix-turn-helix domain